ncbi:MAG: hypothetical protein M3273_00980 [Actinomycetota bacterium]|nr:hypothetical protein [Actinomycetota bacterium]
MRREKAKVRELFIEELAQVHGGDGDPLEKLKEWLRDQFQTTHACCEEGPGGCCSDPF